MYKHILIATDGSDVAGRALAHGLAIAKAVKARVSVVFVTEGWSSFDLAHEARMGRTNPIAEFDAAATAAARQVLDVAGKAASEQGVACELVHVADKHPAEGIVETARDKGCDLIVMGSHGRRGINRLLLGSRAYEVLTHSAVPTLVVR
jgi:nucleotide-binding universal stress UspA family protein